jgi:hypothetical protein
LVVIISPDEQNFKLPRLRPHLSTTQQGGDFKPVLVAVPKSVVFDLMDTPPRKVRLQFNSHPLPRFGLQCGIAIPQCPYFPSTVEGQTAGHKMGLHHTDPVNLTYSEDEEDNLDEESYHQDNSKRNPSPTTFRSQLQLTPQDNVESLKQCIKNPQPCNMMLERQKKNVTKMGGVNRYEVM